MDDVTTILVVTPHPDDAEGGAGGSIAKWAREGKKVVLVLCTNGDKGTGDISVRPEELARTREEEQRKAAEVMGVAEVVFLRIPDQGLDDTPEFRERIVREIRKHKPELVVTIDPNRPYVRHRDHYHTGRVTLDAVFPYARDIWAYPAHQKEGLEPHKVRTVYLWGSDEPDTFIDISDTFDTKLKALYCHASQIEPEPEREARMRERFGEAGKRVGARYAESFKRIELRR